MAAKGSKQSKNAGKTSRRSAKPSSAKSKREANWKISKKSWWYIGTVSVVFLILILIVWWFTSGPGQPRSDSVPVDPVDRVNMYADLPEMKIDTSRSYVATIVTSLPSLRTTAFPKTSPPSRRGNRLML